MARLFITPADGNYILGPSLTDLSGTTGAETVTLAANSKTIFDTSWNKGGDTINIGGNAGTYSARLNGTTLILTAANGANIEIPAGVAGASIKFANDTAARELVIEGGQVYIGEQALSSVAVVLDDDGPVEPPVGNEISLSVTKDTLTGTSGDDIFRAEVVQNQNGEQTNELGSGDTLRGGAGNDQLQAAVQDASPLNGGPASSIAPITNSVETAHFRALSTGLTIGDAEIDDIARLFSGFVGGESVFTGAGPQLGVEINAARMLGLEEVGSVQSDDSLTIYNLTTLTNTGNYADRRLTEEITVRMDHTGNGTLVEYESDLTVLFDQNYLLAAGDVERGAQLVIEIMDMDAALAGRDPLEDNPFGEIDFTMDGQLFTLTYGTTANTYAELLADVQEALDANPAFVNLTASLGGTFVASDTDSDPGGTAIGTSIVITNSGPEELVAVTMRAIGDAPAGKDFHTNFEAQQGDLEGFLITSNIVLNKVGRGGDGGDLTVGGMNTDGANVWGYGSGPNKPPVVGVEQFNIVVEGDDTQPTDLASLQSTNNQLRVVNLASATGSEATFTLGNEVTGNVPLTLVGESSSSDNFFGGSSVDVSTFRNQALKDVLIFNAADFVNDSEVWGHFSEETVAKYINRVDTDVDAAADNANAVYTFGVGDNILNMNLDKANFEATGTESREDFSFTANMGAGNDIVQIQIGDGFNAIGEAGESIGGEASMFDSSYAEDDGLQTVQNWYANHVINGGLASPVANLTQNLTVNTEAGDDGVVLWGATAADVNLGDGNDWVFTDNSGQIETFNGGKAAWVFNQRSNNVNDLQSQTPVAITNVANLGLTVTFQNFLTKTVVVGNSAGSINGVTVSDLTINQAIKDAINNDPFLNKLLIAEDGPARTLIVRSLIDGETVVSDLTVNLVSTGPLTLAQQNGTSLGLLEPSPNTLVPTALGFSASGAPLTSGSPTGQYRWDSEYATTSGFGGFTGQLTGFDSINVNNNNVEGGLGNDLIVLSSNGIGRGIGVNSSNEGNSTETIDINGVFGDDKILNFTAAVGLADVPEIQSITFAGAAAAGGTVRVTYNGVNYDVLVDAVSGGATPTTAAEIATAVAAAITAGTDATAVATADTVVITHDTAGIDIPLATVTVSPTAGAFEVSEFTFTGAPTAGETVTLNFAGFSFGYLVQAGDTIDTVINELADEADNILPGANVVVDLVGDTLTLTNTVGGNVPNATVSIVSGQAITLNVAVENTDGTVLGVTGVVTPVQNGTIPADGYDIFDVTTVLNGAVDVPSFLNMQQLDGTVATPVEANAIQARITGNTNNYVLLTDTIEQNDYGSFAVAHTTELARLTEIVRDADTATQASATDGIVITVDGATNIGTFYYVVDGVAANDSTVTRLGSVQFGTYDHISKDAIGDWDLLTITNFQPLNVDGLEGTYDVIG